MKSVLIYAAGLILSIIAMFVVMPHFIAYLKKKNINQVTSEYALQEFKDKRKTPIMGGLLFVLIPIFVYIIIYFKGLGDRRLLFILLSYVLYCSVGFIDDCLVISSQTGHGIRLCPDLVCHVQGYHSFTGYDPVCEDNRSIEMVCLFTVHDPAVYG